LTATLHRTISPTNVATHNFARRLFGADVMIKSLIRIISELFAPGLDMIARMPASATRQILFPL
jgi:hypothetical protein